MGAIGAADVFAGLLSLGTGRRRARRRRRDQPADPGLRECERTRVSLPHAAARANRVAPRDRQPAHATRARGRGVAAAEGRTGGRRWTSGELIHPLRVQGPRLMLKPPTAWSCVLSRNIARASANGRSPPILAWRPSSRFPPHSVWLDSPEVWVMAPAPRPP